MSKTDHTRQSQEKVLGRLAACETAIAKLYERYAVQLPDSRDVWTSIAEDEYQHAAALRALQCVLQRGYLFSNLDRFREDAVLVTMGAIRQAALELTSHGAFLAALRIESSLVETGFYDVVESDAPEFRTVAAALAKETRGHIDFLKARMAAAMGSEPLATQPAGA